ncbi:MAG TPA: hypothetical protein VFA20_06320 [Myxococcaceae bacterium]|nr:hypothetical protein [Myxococcaceae bacterium]
MSVPLLLAQATAEHVQEMSQVGAGRIVGGWEYVWACYLIAWIGIGLYTVSILVRRRGRKGTAV